MSKIPKAIIFAHIPVTPLDSSLRAAATFDLRRGASHHVKFPGATVLLLEQGGSTSHISTFVTRPRDFFHSSIDVKVPGATVLEAGGKPSTWLPPGDS